MFIYLDFDLDILLVLESRVLFFWDFTHNCFLIKYHCFKSGYSSTFANMAAVSSGSNSSISTYLVSIALDDVFIKRQFVRSSLSKHLNIFSEICRKSKNFRDFIHYVVVDAISKLRLMRVYVLNKVLYLIFQFIVSINIPKLISVVGRRRLLYCYTCKSYE